MESLIVEKKQIELNPSQTAMLKSGWGADAIDNSAVYKITYLSDGLKVKGYVAVPKNLGKEKYPCVIWNRGGFGNSGAIDEFTARGIFGQLASWGYVVFASQYRGNAGSEGYDEFGGSDVNDILNLIPLAEEIKEADKSLWGIEGWSRGGMMTYLALKRSDIFKAVIISGGIADLHCNAQESRFMRMLYREKLGEMDSAGFKEKCMERSVINFADKLPRTAHYLLLHGTGDERVSPKDSLALSYKLLENNIPFRLVMLEGGDHFLKSHRREADKMRRQWYERFLVK